MKMVFLGTGASTGVPVIGCPCGVCLSKNPCNHRLRTSALIEWEGKRILIDAGPDLREQALRYGIDHLDGVILTHGHYDHIGGIDELRVYSFIQKKRLPCLLLESVYQELKTRYAHLFVEPDHGKTIAAQLHFTRVQGRGGCEFEGIPIRYLTYSQAGTEVMGIRIENMAYLTDIRDYPETIFDDLKGVETLIVSALRYEPSHLHFSIDEAVTFIQKVAPKRAYLVHMAHEIDCETIKLPEHIKLAYDGLEIS